MQAGCGLQGAVKLFSQLADRWAGKLAGVKTHRDLTLIGPNLIDCDSVVRLVLAWALLSGVSVCVIVYTW